MDSWKNQNTLAENNFELRSEITHKVFRAVEKVYLELKNNINYSELPDLAAVIDECLEEVGIRLLDAYGNE